MLAPLVDNLSLDSTYTTGVDRTEFQDGNASTFAVGLDYLVAGSASRTTTLPGWVSGALGALPGLLRAGPAAALRASAFRWNPTELRVSTGFVRGTDRRVSFLNPSGDVADDPAVSAASTRLWRNAGALGFQPTPGTALRWEIQSLRDFRDYRDTAGTSSQLAPSRRRARIRARAVDVGERVDHAVFLVVVPAARRSRNPVRHAPRPERAVARHAPRRDRRGQRARDARLAGGARSSRCRDA